MEPCRKPERRSRKEHGPTDGFLVREALLGAAQTGNHDIDVVMTRESDINLGLAERAKVARDNNADLFLCIHFNGFNGSAMGVETLVRPAAFGNINHAEDKAFARRIQKSRLVALRS